MTKKQRVWYNNGDFIEVINNVIVPKEENTEKKDNNINKNQIEEINDIYSCKNSVGGIKNFYEERKIQNEDGGRYIKINLYKKGILIQTRWFDVNGNPIRDRDYTDHGNPKEHPVVPHDHLWPNRVRNKNWDNPDYRWR